MPKQSSLSRMDFVLARQDRTLDRFGCRSFSDLWPRDDAIPHAMPQLTRRANKRNLRIGLDTARRLRLRVR